MTQLTDPTEVSPINPEMAADITKFEEMLADYQAGRVPEDVFRVFRLNNGIYGQRQGGTNQMVRVKVPYGAMTAGQLDLLADVVADNCSSSGIVVGSWQSVDCDLTNLGMILEIYGRPRQIGSSAAILGNPIRSLVSAARLSTAAGEPLEAGWIVMAGGATAAEALAAGDFVRNTVQRLGAVGFSVSP